MLKRSESRGKGSQRSLFDDIPAERRSPQKMNALSEDDAVAPAAPPAAAKAAVVDDWKADWLIDQRADTLPDAVQPFAEVFVGRYANYPHSDTPAVIVPRGGAKKKANLMEFIEKNHAKLVELLNKRGALCFRGFENKTAQDFEDVCLKLEKDLGANYLGTSPRNMVTKYTFTASELPPFFPIPQHLEVRVWNNIERSIKYLKILNFFFGYK